MPLTDAERRELESLIKQRREELTREIDRGVARVRSDNITAVGGEARDAGDEATASLVFDTDKAETSRDVEELRGLDAALRRMAEGTYGICADCGDEIPFERLKVYLGAMRCVRCQSIHEKIYTRPSEPTL